METYQIVNWLRDKAVRADNPSWTRMMHTAADHLLRLEYRLEQACAERDAVTKRMIELEQKQRWIPVTERLPELHINDYEEPDGSRMQFEVSDDLWVITTSGLQTKARYETGPVFQGWVGEYGETVENVTNWRTLPEPPKEDEDA